MRPPPALLSRLRVFDRRLRVRWSEPLGLYAIDRKHGSAGDNQAILGFLSGMWAQAEQQSSLDPLNVNKARRARGLWDEFSARRQGYQPILYVTPRLADQPALVERKLYECDIRRHGGALGYWRKMIAEQEEADRRRAVERRARLRDAVETALDKTKAGRKDWYAGGELTGSKDVPEAEAERRTGNKRISPDVIPRVVHEDVIE